MSQDSKNKQKLDFKFTHEGCFAFKNSIFELKISDLPRNPRVGIARELVFPVFEITTDIFTFLLDKKNIFVVNSYKGFSTKSENSNEFLKLMCKLQNNSDKNGQDAAQDFYKVLDSKFNRYELGEIFHNFTWGGNDKYLFPAQNFSIEDFLMGAGIYISEFRLGFEEYGKYGLGYRWFNVPSRIASFEISMGEELNIFFKVSRGITQKFLDFFCKIIEVIADTFSFESDALVKIQEIKRIATSYVVINHSVS